ncbi:MAG TPA: hypothetical protein VD815_05240 [Candidatus Saccharimonadales bacterium]|nr:hypothetical protein [Candidatus Saccharimonadales bacterium]
MSRNIGEIKMPSNWRHPDESRKALINDCQNFKNLSSIQTSYCKVWIGSNRYWFPRYFHHKNRTQIL